ncbi:hypothetical protein OAU50_03095 [Planctomycetota bacterium]|nr:hypothetical protein [Planctomycetota bacterium]
MSEREPYGISEYTPQVSRGSIGFGFLLVMVIHLVWVAGFQTWYVHNRGPASFLNYPPPVFGLAIAQFIYVGPIAFVAMVLPRWKTLIGIAIGAAFGACVTGLIILIDPLI